jgi:hypothetical protein
MFWMRESECIINRINSRRSDLGGGPSKNDSTGFSHVDLKGMQCPLPFIVSVELHYVPLWKRRKAI